ncbi:hypothetical protein [Nocardia bhagyanarayanae]|uniref:Uncharacterized protein n=1 Tax=Nocardia bhagyanarayanae TaxID=1215925 RepID=A0A543FFY6_9NOCA|nr:hypothetical protein [Nocardia bhagyanarayanae]TQM32691.1 hypothetical protein FB390_4386 [Nocardia bhagyanarayanae]
MAESEQPIAQWQAQLLRTVMHWARVEAAELASGAQKYDLAADAEYPAFVIFAANLDAIRTQRENAEAMAVEAGIDAAWVRDVREAALSGSAQLPAPMIVPDRLSRTNDVERFIADLLLVDLHQLERMVVVTAAIEDRQATGRWSMTFGPEKVQQFTDNLVLRHQRVQAHAHGAAITAAEGERLWGSAAQAVRRQHAVWALAATETDLAASYLTFARITPERPVPPYIDIDPVTGAPLRRAQSLLPSPAAMLVEARATLRAEFVTAALADSTPDAGLDTGVAITAALPSMHSGNIAADQVSLPEPNPDRGPDQEHDMGP